MHLRRILTQDRRLTAMQVAERLQGMCLLVLATVTADGRPRLGPIDSVFYRGAFYVGTSPDALRWRHILARPQVSATYVPREELAVTVHGVAVPIDVSAEDGGGLRRTLVAVYDAKNGHGWTDPFLDSGVVYARIDAERMFTLQLG